MSENRRTGTEMAEDLKMYFVCRYDGPEWFYCFGVLSNGFCFGEHLCSSPRFAPGDLYSGRPDRIEALNRLFGKKWDKAECIVVREKADVPEWWEGQAALQDGLKDLYARYTLLLAEAKPEAGGT